jgi:hypothetical protein
MRAIHTLRGIVGGSTTKIIFDNDLRNVGWKIKEFYLWPDNMDANNYVWGKLWIGNDGNLNTSSSQADDNRAIAWAQSSGSTPESVATTIVDPNHIVTGQLRIASGSGDAIAYLIVLEQMTLSTDQEIMALIKERSQDDI